MPRPYQYPDRRHVRCNIPEQPLATNRGYKRYLREEFGRRCVYCCHPDGMHTTIEHFGVEHYLPHRDFPEHRWSYSNLYYACNRCNRLKGARFYQHPDHPELPHYIPNPCDHIMSNHLEYDGWQVQAHTEQGRCAKKVLLLNDMDFVDFRIVTTQVLSKAQAELQALREESAWLREEMAIPTLSAEARADLETRARIVAGEIAAVMTTVERIVGG